MQGRELTFDNIDKAVKAYLATIDESDKDIRQKKIKPSELWNLALDYFEDIKKSTWFKPEVLKSGDQAGRIISVPVSTPMSISGFCVYAGITKSSWNRYRGNKHSDTEVDYEAYEVVAEFIQMVIESDQLEGAMVGAYESRIVASVLGLAEKKEVTGENGGAIKLEQITGMKIV